MVIFGIIIGLIVLVLLVVVHELGHAIAAQRNGVVVEEFGIGFPPRAWSKKLKNGVLFTLNWLPLGGFVKLQGEHDAASKKGDYGAASFWAKTKILLAGVFVNWVVAAVLLSIIALFGLPKIVDNQFSIPSDTAMVYSPVYISDVVEDYPAERAGIQAGDAIESVDGVVINTTEQLIEETKARRGQTVEVVYERDGQDETVEVTLRDADSTVFGAGLSQQESIKATWSAPIVGVVTTAQYTWVTFDGLGQLVGNFFGGLFGQLSSDEATREAAQKKLDTANASVSGPVGILGVIFPAASQAGPLYVTYIAAIISLTLAVMNILPIPALDGGRWFVSAIFKLFKKPLRKDLEEKIHGTGFMFLMLLVVLITVADIAKIF